MKKVSGYLFLVLSLYVLCQVLTVYAEESPLNVNDIIKRLDPGVITKAEFKEYFRTIEGKKARGGGQVVHVLPSGDNLFRIMILTSASSPEKGYNVVLFTSQNALYELHENSKIIFEGKISRVNPYKGASIDINGTYIRSE
jgi:hypothetical protein